MPFDLKSLSADELKKLSPARTVFFLPIGPLEDHGPHLPMGMDLLEARALCDQAAQKLERDLPGWVGVILPDSPMSVNTNTSATAIRVRAHVVRDYLIDTCRSLKRAGFLHFVCFSGNAGPRQLTAIEEAGKTLMRRRHLLPFLPAKGGLTFISATSATLRKGEVRRSPLWPDPLEHGGRRDTSIALHLGAQTAEGYANLRTVVRPKSSWARAWARWTRQTFGYWGAPAEATAHEGEQLLLGTIDDIFPKMCAVWEGSNPNSLFRSWYSVLPPNQSLFKIWLLAIVLVVLLWVWVVFLVRGLATG